MRDLRALPSVEQLLQTEFCARLLAEFGRPLTVAALRGVLDEIRADESAPIPQRVEILLRTELALRNATLPTLLPVINASGVVLHTNLGRAPLSRAALAALQSTAQGYNNLEFDLARGARGQRSVHCEALLTRLTGAEAALVVNNNAAALLLALSALAARRRVIIARSQLVEIGGGFRVPDVMKQSGARLVEVGTTNRVHAADFEEALAAQPAALVLRAHTSNFRIVGFTSEPSLAELAVIAHSHDIPLVDDLGSGALLDTARFGLAHEPTVQESIAAGADLVCFSGDKLLGGPQAGILVGRADLLARVKKHPLARAVRADKLCLAALAATLLHYVKDEAEREIPIWRMIATPLNELRARAADWAEQLGAGQVIAAQSTVGGGSLPEETLPTCALAFDVRQPNAFLARLRRARTPVIARVENEQVLLDPRTVLPDQDADLLDALRTALEAHTTSPRKP